MSKKVIVSKKVIDNKKKISKKMVLAIKMVKSKKSNFYIFENKMLKNKEVKKFFQKK
ncbi:DUF4295 family protein [Blattabacterium cuenoti]|uniref:DUF4295 family protein n=1 Tax=Blattabacterium cuenoti TaxID=1653831 RepID=UPI00163C0898|nr:DUF4295 family protein [Blattabacterium cuenoti]